MSDDRAAAERESVERAGEVCPRCGHTLRVGDYPFCRGKADDHIDPHYGWQWGAR